MKRALLESDRLRISKPGHDVETMTLAGTLFDSDIGPAGSISMAGKTLIDPANFALIENYAYEKYYRALLPLNRTYPSPPGALVTLLSEPSGETHVNWGRNTGANITNYQFATTTTEIVFYIRVAVLPGGTFQYPWGSYVAWVIFNPPA